MSYEDDQKIKLREEKYDPFRAIIDEGEAILTHDPSLWWFATVRFLLKFQKRIEQSGQEYPQEVEAFLLTYGNAIIEMVEEERHKPKTTHDSSKSTKNAGGNAATRAVDVMHSISEVLMSDERLESEHRTIEFLSFEEICSRSARFRVTERPVEDGSTRKFFGIYSKLKKEWYDYPIPSCSKVLHKGGMGRTILKILAGASEECIEAELPPNDFDYLVVKDDEGIEEASRLGADPDGVEAVSEFDLQQLMDNRDLNMNNAFVGQDGLYYSQDAYEAAATGKIAIVSTKRGIYGSEVFYYDRVRLLKNRGIMRLLKTVAEKKAVSFDLLPINRQIGVGIYWLVLAKRFSRKENFPEIMDRLFELAKQIGQVGEDMQGIYDILDEAHAKYPFFDFDGHPLDETGVARWMGRKLIKQVDKKYRDVYGIPSLINLDRQDGDTTPYEVSLEGYAPNQERLALIRSEWRRFLARSRRRTNDYYEGVQVDAFENGTGD